MPEMNEKAAKDELSVEFGYYPVGCNIGSDCFSIQVLPGLEESVAAVSEDAGVFRGWAYAGVQKDYDVMTGRVHDMPYNARIFGLPRTHVMTLYERASTEKIEFLVWCMSFFVGMRLTTAEAGFLDATPVKPGELVDFSLRANTMVDAIHLSIAYFESHRAEHQSHNRVEAIIHALFLSQYPQSLEFEKFQYLYMALDACFKLLSDKGARGRRIPHASRIQWMCELLEMPVPGWAKYSGDSPAPVAAVRNDAFHEALFFGGPLGFSIYGGNQRSGDQANVILQMQALVCRLLVAILGRPEARYVRTSIETRQIYGLDI
ncbi:MAG: hypothetical protein RH947_09330 [Alcanivorax sp.]